MYALLNIVYMATTTISARVDSDEVKLLEALAEEEGCDRSALIKSLLRRGLRALRLEKALASFSAEEVTLSKAAEKAGLSIWDFMALMPDHHLNLHYDVAEFEEDLEAFEKKPLSKMIVVFRCEPAHSFWRSSIDSGFFGISSRSRSRFCNLSSMK